MADPHAKAKKANFAAFLEEYGVPDHQAKKLLAASMCKTVGDAVAGGLGAEAKLQELGMTRMYSATIAAQLRRLGAVDNSDNVDSSKMTGGGGGGAGVDLFGMLGDDAFKEDHGEHEQGARHQQMGAVSNVADMLEQSNDRSVQKVGKMAFGVDEVQDGLRVIVADDDEGFDLEIPELEDKADYGDFGGVSLEDAVGGGDGYDDQGRHDGGEGREDSSRSEAAAGGPEEVTLLLLVVVVVVLVVVLLLVVLVLVLLVLVLVLVLVLLVLLLLLLVLLLLSVVVVLLLVLTLSLARS